MKKILLLITLLISSCSQTELATLNTTSAICEGLKEPIDTLAETLVEEQEKTPDRVLINGTRVIKGYDVGCKS